jgi:hypothetical protein
MPFWERALASRPQLAVPEMGPLAVLLLLLCTGTRGPHRKVHQSLGKANCVSSSFLRRQPRCPRVLKEATRVGCGHQKPDFLHDVDQLLISATINGMSW